MDNQSPTVQELLQEVAALKRRLAELERLQPAPDPGDALPCDGEAKYQRLAEMAAIGTFQSSPEGRVITANQAFADMFGYESPADVISSVQDIVADMCVDPQRRLDIVLLMMENQNLRSFENIYRRKDGSTFPGNLHIWPVRDGDGRLSMIEGFVEDVTERKRIEEESRKCRRFLSDLIENTGALVCAKDRDGRYEMVNSKWEEVTGLTRRNVIGKTDEELFPGPTGKEFRRNDLEVMESGFVLGKEETLADAQGVRFFISIKFPLRGDDGVIRGIYGVITEITARKAVAEELVLSRNRLSRAEIISRSGNWEFDLESNRVFASDGARRIYGLMEGEWTIPEVQKIPLPEYRELLDQALRGLIDENRPYNLEFKIRRPDTGEIVDIHSVAEYDRHRKVVFGVIRDITEHRRTKQDLRESEELYRTFINATSDMVFLKDELLRNIVVNKTMAVFFGKPEGEIIGKSDFELMPQIAAENCRRTDLAALSGLSVVITEEIVGDYVYETLKFPVELGKNRVGVGGFIRNITARKQVEEELSESRRRLADIIDFLPDATLVIDQEGKVIAWNRAMEAMTGVRKEGMLGKGNYEYALPFYGSRRPILIDYALHPDKDLGRQYSAMQRVGDIILGEAFTPNLRGDMHLYATASVLRDSKGKIIAAIECIRDNTERKKLAERLNRAEKMEGLGRLAGGVAHDLNNILGVLVGYSELLGEKLPQESPLRRYADNILQAGLRGAAIIQDLLTLARRGVAVAELVDLNRIVSDYLKTPEFELLRSEHGEVQVHIELTEGLLNVKGSPIHLSKTLANLVANAAEAIAGRGEVTIKTENRYLDVPVRGYDDMQEGDYAVLTVSDTGKGIPAKDLGKIFEPFYTMKVMGTSGTGLGLAVVWGTVKDHNGYVDVRSEVGKGSDFIIYLPVTREEAVKKERAVDVAAYLGKGETILVVDDVKEQRELAISMLESLGYEVEAVASGEGAIDYLESKKADLIVLDMIMEPGIDGLETYQRIIKSNPRQRAVIVSGFSETDRVRKAQELGAGAFVRKPYVLEKIGLAVRKELDRR
jgi:two-component system, cell cycle sensor histidine kinase and response regulator CckA